MQLSRRTMIKGVAAITVTVGVANHVPVIVTSGRVFFKDVFQPGDIIRFGQYNTLNKKLTQLCLFKADQPVNINWHEIWQYGDRQVAYFYDDSQSYCKEVSMDSNYLLDDISVGVFTYGHYQAST